MKYLATVLLFTCLFGQPSSSTVQADQFAEIRTAIETAVDSSNSPKLLQLTQKLDTLSQSKQPMVRQYAYYYRGYAFYRLQSSFSGMGEDQKEQYLDRAIGMFKKALKLDPDFAEAHALLGSSYGVKASGFFSGMKYGPKSGNQMDKAQRLAPDNPRVVMLDAIATLYKPSMFGGSTQAAIDGFQRAIELFKNWQPPNAYAPRWGNAKVYAWLGQAYVQAENFDAARQAYQKALQVKPGYPWVAYKLIPALKQKMKQQ